MIKTCTVSGQKFEVTSADLDFYKKMGVPTPRLCPAERRSRRLRWRNGINLYRRQCDGTGKTIISNFDETVKFPVYEQSYWWGDSWDGADFGRDFDFSRTFMENFMALYNQVPQFNLSNIRFENCDFCNYGINNKNGYLGFSCGYCEDYYYSELTGYSQKVADCFRADYCELSYECVDCQNGYLLRFAQDSAYCRDSWFLQGCQHCTNCVGCVNLEHKQFYIYNESYTEKEYWKALEAMKLSSFSSLKKVQQAFLNFKQSFPCNAFHNQQTENCTGDYFYHGKNLKACFDLIECEDGAYGASALEITDSYDFEFGAMSRGIYECLSQNFNEDNQFCFYTTQVQHAQYCQMLFNSSNCFGCVGLRHKKHHILNKSYSAQDYKILKEKIIVHMKQTGEWGEFFPSEYSPFKYNQSQAQDYFPRSKTECLSLNYGWKEEDPGAKYEGPQFVVADDIKDVTDDIINQILVCADSGKNYRLVKQELDLYRALGVPLPRESFMERRKVRWAQRNRQQLHHRTCDRCAKQIETTFEVGQPETVWCEDCYLNHALQ